MSAALLPALVAAPHAFLILREMSVHKDSVNGEHQGIVINNDESKVAAWNRIQYVYCPPGATWAKSFSASLVTQASQQNTKADQNAILMTIGIDRTSSFGRDKHVQKKTCM